jgi:dipeptidase D
MPEAIEGLKPQGLWRYFAEVSRIPRGSKNEAAISKYVLETARKLGCEARADKLGTVVARMACSPGYENARRVCLQGHLDMVCEKNRDKEHDFLKDPIALVRKDGVLKADGTTLGADNGIALAASLAIMADKSIEHPPLEFLFTVDEETGLTGACNLEPGFLESRILLNLDTEEEGALYVGCSGGRDTRGTWKAAYEAPGAGCVFAEIRVRGLKGGHSGMDIDKGRGNSVKIIARLLRRLGEVGARLASLNAGSKHNAIPREADALVALPKKSVERARALAAGFEAAVKAEMSSVEPGLSVAFEVLPRGKARVLKKPLERKLLQALTALPHGVVKMSADIPGLVETSTNVAVVSTDKKTISIVTSQRSSVASEIDEIAETVRTVLELAGAEVASSDGYPGWKPDLNSEVLKTARAVYSEMFGKEPLIKAIHAGLECGIIGEKNPGMDMVSLGPTLENVHSPDEAVHVESVERFFDYLTALLRKIG